MLKKNEINGTEDSATAGNGSPVTGRSPGPAKSRTLREAPPPRLGGTPVSDPAASDAEPARPAGPAAAAKLAARGIAQLILMVAVLAGAMYAVNVLVDAQPEPRKRPAFRTVYTVDTATVAIASHQPEFTAYGEIVASRTVDLRALVAGEVVSVSPSLKVGARVAEGDALVEIDRFNYEGALSEARANLAETEARIAEYRARITMEEGTLERASEQLDFAQTDLERITALRENGTSTQKQVDDRALIVSQRNQTVERTRVGLIAERAKLEQQTAIRERLEWRVDQAERNLADTVLRAPFTGVIRQAQAEVGRMLGANDVAVSIYEDDRLEVRFTLTDERYGRIRSDTEGLIGRPVKVTWTIGGEDHVYDAAIERLGAEIASARGGVEVFAALADGPQGVEPRPGAFVAVRVPDRRFENSTLLPETAVYGGDTVYVVNRGALEPRPVKVRAYVGGDAIVTGELADGEEVMTTRIAEINPGLRVRKEGQTR